MERNLEMQIFNVDRKKHTIQLNVGGCLVTVLCEPQNNPETYTRLRDILIDSVLHSPGKENSAYSLQNA